jgi:GntR family transcriptional regulator
VKLWLSKNSEVPIREQLEAQIILAIASGDLSPGDRLPSTRQISIRNQVHPNTVAASYQRLVDLGHIEFRHGSGYYVSNSGDDAGVEPDTFENAARRFLAEAEALGVSAAEAINRLTDLGAAETTNRVTLVEPDPDLREILAFELVQEGFRVSSMSLEEFQASEVTEHGVLAAFFDEKPKLDPIIGDGAKCVYLNGRSVSGSITGHDKPGENDIVAVVSAWHGFLSLSRIILLAAGIQPGNLIIRSTKDEGFDEISASSSLLVCDSVTAQGFSRHPGLRVFPVISDESIEELRSACR